MEIEAPVVGVTVYPDRARVTRRGSARLTAGEHRVRIAPLPLGLHRDSLRVGGRGAATVLGVDVTTWRQARSADGQVRELEERSRELTDELAGVDDAYAVEEQRGQFLSGLAERAGGTYARALAAGDAEPADVAAFADSVAGQLADSHGRRRELARRRTELTEDLAAVRRQLEAAHGKREPDRLAAEVTVAVDVDDAELDLELTYLVDGARWQPSYDLRLVDDTVTVTWFGLVSQDTGEDWPECVLQLSTARPAAATGVPELSPWYLDRVRPLPKAAMPAASFGAVPAPAPPGGPASWACRTSSSPCPAAPARWRRSPRRSTCGGSASPGPGARCSTHRASSTRSCGSSTRWPPRDSCGSRAPTSSPPSPPRATSPPCAMARPGRTGAGAGVPAPGRRPASMADRERPGPPGHPPAPDLRPVRQQPKPAWKPLFHNR
ncbi:mucoidy inhibitor MuiA family protein [Micromonospora sp. DH15]|nr:mucoidy inhibitor MuiA family protein [Micromonospora sp. DH15]